MYHAQTEQPLMDFGNGFTWVQESSYDDNPISGHDYDNDQFYEPRLTSDDYPVLLPQFKQPAACDFD